MAAEGVSISPRRSQLSGHGKVNGENLYIMHCSKLLSIDVFPALIPKKKRSAASAESVVGTCSRGKN